MSLSLSSLVILTVVHLLSHAPIIHGFNVIAAISPHGRSPQQQQHFFGLNHHHTRTYFVSSYNYRMSSWELTAAENGAENTNADEDNHADDIADFNGTKSSSQPLSELKKEIVEMNNNNNNSNGSSSMQSTKGDSDADNKANNNNNGVDHSTETNKVIEKTRESTSSSSTTTTTRATPVEEALHDDQITPAESSETKSNTSSTTSSSDLIQKQVNSSSTSFIHDTSPPLTFKKYLTMQDKRVPVAIRYSQVPGLRPFFLSVANKIKKANPDVVIEKLILPTSEGQSDTESVFEVLVDNKVVIGKANSKWQPVSRSGKNTYPTANIDFVSGMSVFISMEEVNSAISKSRRKRRPSTSYVREAEEQGGTNTTPAIRLEMLKGVNSGESTIGME